MISTRVSVQTQIHSKSQGHEYNLIFKLSFCDVCAFMHVCVAFAQLYTPSSFRMKERENDKVEGSFMPVFVFCERGEIEGGVGSTFYFLFLKL